MATVGTPLRHTPLHDQHVGLGAKMVDFGGWHMPLQYEGILAEHRRVRGDVGIFDVSHMGEIDFIGPGALAAVQRLITNDAARLSDGHALYTTVCYPDGGIVDDCIVYRFGPQLYRIVVNAANIAKDHQHFLEVVDGRCDLVDRSDAFALIAVQGPRAASLVAQLAAEPALADLPAFAFAPAHLAGAAIIAARTGYTGEDGFELFIDAAAAAAVWSALHAAGAAPIGLGARDTLRLEARLSLYGNDIDATTSPLEAGLGWVVKLDKLARGDAFVGADALQEQKSRGLTRRLVGLRLRGRGIARHGAEVLNAAGEPVGLVTSGGPAPTVGGAVALAYVPTAMSEPGALITLRQRDQLIEAEVVKGPFYKRPTPST